MQDQMRFSHDRLFNTSVHLYGFIGWEIMVERSKVSLIFCSPVVPNEKTRLSNLKRVVGSSSLCAMLYHHDNPLWSCLLWVCPYPDPRNILPKRLTKRKLMGCTRPHRIVLWSLTFSRLWKVIVSHQLLSRARCNSCSQPRFPAKSPFLISSSRPHPHWMFQTRSRECSCLLHHEHLALHAWIK